MATRCFFGSCILLWLILPGPLLGQPGGAKSPAFYAELAPHIHHDFCAAVVIHPTRIAQSPLGKSIPLAKLMAEGLKQAELNELRALPFADPSKIRRVTVLIDPFPGGNVAFFPAVVVEYNQETSGRDAIKALFPDSRPAAGDPKLFVDLDFEAGASVHGYVASPRTIVIAPEPTLKKIRAMFCSPRNPIKLQLGTKPVESEIVVEYNSQPALDAILKLTQKNEAQLRADRNTDEAVKMLLLDVKSASLHWELRKTQSIRAEIQCDDPRVAGEFEEAIQSGLEMLKTVLVDQATRNKLKKELKAQKLPAPLIDLMDSKAIKDLVYAVKIERRRTEIMANLSIPQSALDLVTRSMGNLTGPAVSLKWRADGTELPNGRVRQFEWAKGQREITVTHQDDGIPYLTGVQGALRGGAEVAIRKDPEGYWRLSGTNHAGLVGRAAAAPWFVGPDSQVTTKLWRRGQADFPKLIHQRDGFCVLSMIGGAFNGGGEEIRLFVGPDGNWRFNARSKAPRTQARVIIVKLKRPGTFHGVAREHSWKKGDKPVRLIHKNDGIAFLSGVAGAFAGGAEYARVRLDDDGHWYLEGRSRQKTLIARAMTIQLTKPQSTSK